MAERKRTNAEIDILNQFVEEGKTPIPYELDATNNDLENNEPTEEEKLAAQKKEDDEIEAAKQKEIDDAAILAEQSKTKEPAKVAEPKIEIPELDDAAILAYLKNKKGKDITSLDDLINPKPQLTPEEKIVEAQKREDNMYAYGLTNGLFNKKELEQFVKDTNNPIELVKESFKAAQKSKDPEITDDEIEAEFNEKFSLEEDTDSRKYKIGQDLINNIADNLIAKKHSKILGLEKEYSSYEGTQSKQKEVEQKIATQTPIYQKDIAQIKDEIKKVSIPLNDKENFEGDIDESIVNEIMTEMLDSKYAQDHIKNGWNKDNLKQVAQTTAILKSLPKLMTAYKDQELLKKQAGIRGVIPEGKEETRKKSVADLTEQQKQAIAEMDKMSLAN